MLLWAIFFGFSHRLQLSLPPAVHTENELNEDIENVDDVENEPRTNERNDALMFHMSHKSAH